MPSSSASANISTHSVEAASEDSRIPSSSSYSACETSSLLPLPPAPPAATKHQQTFTGGSIVPKLLLSSSVSSVGGGFVEISLQTPPDYMQVSALTATQYSNDVVLDRRGDAKDYNVNLRQFMKQVFLSELK